LGINEKTVNIERRRKLNKEMTDWYKNKVENYKKRLKEYRKLLKDSEKNNFKKCVL
jgi:hypothetical protein